MGERRRKGVVAEGEKERDLMEMEAGSSLGNRPCKHK